MTGSGLSATMGLIPKTFEWDSHKTGERAPHLNKGQAKMLLERVLQFYKDQVGSLPRKVVLHKTSR